MKKLLLFLSLFFLLSAASAQRVHIGVFGGLAAYNGDLTEKLFPKKVTNGALGITGNYELNDHIMLRAGITYAIVGGADRFSKDSVLRARNLAFETTLWEFSLLGEYYLLNLYDTKYSPYVFAGISVFHFDPYAYDLNSQKIYLKPLSTEGQGILGYSAKPYSLNQIAIPFGGGVKFAVTDNLRVGVEMGLRRTFTDYLDDVSTNYVDANDLLAAKGQLAVDMSYRGDDVGSGPYPAKGSQRGSAKAKDYYYFSGIHLTYKLGNGYGGSSKKNKTGCPTNVY